MSVPLKPATSGRFVLRKVRGRFEAIRRAVRSRVRAVVTPSIASTALALALWCLIAIALPIMAATSLAKRAAQAVARQTLPTTLLVGSMLVNPFVFAGGGGTPGGHRYFRLRAPNTWLSGFLGLAEIQIREASGGTDLAPGATKTASATFDGSHTVALTVDANASTFWTSGGTFPSGGNWVQFDFGTAKLPTEVTLQVRPSGSREDPKDLVFECSDDGSTWSSLSWSYTGIMAWNAGEIRTFSLSDMSYTGSGAARYFRVLTPTTYAGTNFLGLADVQMRETSGGTDLASGLTPYASATAGGFPTTNATDGSTSTFWTTGGTNTTGGNWLVFDLTTARAITEVKLRVRPDGFREDPKDLNFQVSADTANWFDSWTYTGLAAWSAGEQRTFTKP